MKKIIVLIVVAIFITSPVLAEKVRVFYRQYDGGISVSRGPEEEFDSHMRKLPPYNGERYEDMPYEDIDESQLPTRDENRNKWRGSKGQGVRVDHSIKLKHEKVKEKQDELDEELNKANPDAIKVLKLYRQLDKIKSEREE